MDNIKCSVRIFSGKVKLNWMANHAIQDRLMISFCIHIFNQEEVFTMSTFIKEIKTATSALLSYISTQEFFTTREKCGEA